MSKGHPVTGENFRKIQQKLAEKGVILEDTAGIEVSRDRNYPDQWNILVKTINSRVLSEQLAKLEGREKPYTRTDGGSTIVLGQVHAISLFEQMGLGSMYTHLVAKAEAEDRSPEKNAGQSVKSLAAQLFGQQAPMTSLHHQPAPSPASSSTSSDKSGDLLSKLADCIKYDTEITNCSVKIGPDKNPNNKNNVLKITCSGPDREKLLKHLGGSTIVDPVTNEIILGPERAKVKLSAYGVNIHDILTTQQPPLTNMSSAVKGNGPAQKGAGHNSI